MTQAYGQICSQQQILHFILTVVLYKADLWACLGFLTLHAYLAGLQRSPIMSSTTKSPGDEDAMQTALQQMMRSMSLIRSCHARHHPAVPPKQR